MLYPEPTRPNIAYINFINEQLIFSAVSLSLLDLVTNSVINSLNVS